MKVKKQFKTKQKFDVALNSNDGNSERDGTLLRLEVIPDYFFIIDCSQNIMEDKVWTITEFSTGMKVTDGYTRVEVIEKAKAKLSLHKASFPETIEKSKLILKANGQAYPVNEFE